MIRTEPLSPATATPWLEHFPVGGSRPERMPVEDFPFTVGRNGDCSLPIDSGRVSREHAEIVREGAVYRLRDLGSTNGTFVNGQQVEDAILRDGDLLVFADLEFTFCTGGTGGARATATQPFDAKAIETTGREGTRDIVQSMRRLQETLIARGLSSRFLPIVELESNLTFGYEALVELSPGGVGQSTAQQLLDSVECRLTSRLRQLHRLLAAEEAARHAEALRFFVSLSAAEVGADSLMESLARLRTLVAEDGRLVVEVPDSTACDIPYFREFLHALRNIGIGVAFDNFAGGPAQVAGHAAVAPDYLKLARPLVSGVHQHRQRQRRLETVVRACQDLGCDVIVSGVANAAEAIACRDLGCRFAQGEHFDGSRASGPPPFAPRR